MRDTTKHWQHWVTTALGAWLFLSPWIVGFADATAAAAWNAYLIGAGAIAFSLLSLRSRKVGEDLTNVAFGVWMVIAPWILGYSGVALATANSIIVGALLAAFAVWAVIDRGRVGRDQWASSTKAGSEPR
ncbi:MAG TPA: SPW repeat protein [Pelomicrobium sp.]|nr:SPW repeat protein [Pelomicrobium sp.]